MPDRSRQFAAVRLIVRNAVEFAAIFALWWALGELVERRSLAPAVLTGLILAVASWLADQVLDR